MKHSLKKLSIIALSCLFVSGCFLNDSSATSLVPSSITESSDEPSSSSDSSSEPSSSSSSETPSSSSSSSESSSSSSSSVYENLVEEIKLANTAYSVNIGNSIVIKATVYPLYASHKDVIYESLDESIATVNEKGKVIGKENMSKSYPLEEDQIYSNRSKEARTWICGPKHQLYPEQESFLSLETLP